MSQRELGDGCIEDALRTARTADAALRLQARVFGQVTRICQDRLRPKPAFAEVRRVLQSG